MPESQATPPRLRAVVVHRALTGGLFLMTAVMLLLGSRVPSSLGATPVFVLQAAALAFGASGFGAATVIRSRIQPLERGDSEDTWWQSNFGRALLVWALIESPSVAGTVFHFITGSVLPLIVTGVGLVLLMINAPARLVQD